MLSRWQSTIVDAQGNIQPFAILTVLNEATQAPAQIYASESESQPLPVGSVVADESGYAYFYAHGGRYRIQSTDLNIDWRHVPLGDLAHMDVADLGLGTAATRDVGTGANEVPANSNLGEAAYLPIATTPQAQSLTNDGVVITPKKLADAFSGGNQGIAANGYQILPGGLIIQWGSVSGVSAGTTTNIVLPLAAKEAVLQTFVSIGGGGLNAGDSFSSPKTGNYSATGFTIWTGQMTSAANMRWFALCK